MDNHTDTKKTEKKTYETPTVTPLGKLSTLIQGSSGARADSFPFTSGTRP